MKIKVVNKDYTMFDQEYKVVNMNYDMVVVNNEGDKVPLKMEDVEVIPENDYENIVAECRDILKVRLDKGISLAFYTALFQCIKEKINGQITSIDVFKDDYKVSRRGIWEKSLMIVVNDAVPFEITAVAESHTKKFSITVKDMPLEKFVETTSYNIRQIKKEISQKEMLVNLYKNAVKKVLDNAILVNSNGVKYLTKGQEE